MIPGKDGYYDLIRNVHAYPIKGVVMYQFNENLFFANVKILQEDLEDAVSPDTQVVIIDARAINNIDITAADRLAELSSRLTDLGIHFYITEHTEKLNQQMRQLGVEHLIREDMSAGQYWLLFTTQIFTLHMNWISRILKKKA